MSLRIIKKGLLDTVQDAGRWGHQHLGVNPTGAMDRFSAALANALLGKTSTTPVLEMHFPAATILFQQATVICVTGADFSPSVNGQPISLRQPVAVGKNSVLQWGRPVAGTRCYLSLLHDLKIEPWLDSYSTHTKAAAGGWNGNALQADDELPYKNDFTIRFPPEKKWMLLPWKAADTTKLSNEIDVLIGAEWHWLTDDAQTIFQTKSFYLSGAADRMGYRLSGEALRLREQKSLVSAGVSFGTIQLLPSGELMVLMADHQTTGGYPRIGHVISTHLPRLAQLGPGAAVKWRLTNVEAAEQKIAAQQQYLTELENTCKLKMQNWLRVH